MNNYSHKFTQLDSPFSPGCDEMYRRWRDRKLELQAAKPETQVEVGNIERLSAAEKRKLSEVCAVHNWVVYSSKRHQTQQHTGQTFKSQLKRSLTSMGLSQLDSNLCADQDGISALQVKQDLKRGTGDYIPYSNHAINWHTDGYYNSLDKGIRAMVLHCACPAAQGGANTLLDPELVYILMREHNEQFIWLLMQHDVMTIPANIIDGKMLRAAQSGPVFSVHANSGELHLRYTARTRSIEWKQDESVQAATRFLQQLLHSDSPYIHTVRLTAGQGLMSNNVLHNRSAFENDGPLQRLVYRARYYDRVNGTGYRCVMPQ